MNDTLISALGVEIFQDTANPIAAKQHYRNVVVIADKSVLRLCELFFGTAAYLHVVIPKQAGQLAVMEAEKKVLEFGAFNRGLIYGVTVSNDLSGFDTDSMDAIVISTDDSATMGSFLTHTARVAKELARVAVVTKENLDETYFGEKAVAGLRRVNDFYCGSIRKVRSAVPVKKKPSRSRRKPVKPQ
jgi:hypothetical protein